MPDPTRMKYAACYDVTPNRCTVLECFATRDEAEAAAEGSELEIKILEIDEGEEPSELPGARCYHTKGKVWA